MLVVAALLLEVELETEQSRPGLLAVAVLLPLGPGQIQEGHLAAEPSSYADAAVPSSVADAEPSSSAAADATWVADAAPSLLGLEQIQEKEQRLHRHHRLHEASLPSYSRESPPAVLVVGLPVVGPEQRLQLLLLLQWGRVLASNRSILLLLLLRWREMRKRHRPSQPP